jgi:INO80 complex subunit C
VLELRQTLAEQHSYLHAPRPFKNPAYNKNANRRAKNLKNVLTQERERERADRERRRQEREARMDVDGDGSAGANADALEEDYPTCELGTASVQHCLSVSADISIEAPPSFLPQKKYCDITGLEVCLYLFLRHALPYLCVQAAYTDPQTGLRYHDKSVYELIRGLVREAFA